MTRIVSPLYSHSAMLSELQKIVDAAEHVQLDREQLERIAEVMRSRLHLKVGDCRRS